MDISFTVLLLVLAIGLPGSESLFGNRFVRRPPKTGKCKLAPSITNVRIPTSTRNSCLLTLDQFKTHVLGRPYFGIWEFALENFPPIRKHYGLKITIADNGTQWRRIIDFDTSLSSPTCNSFRVSQMVEEVPGANNARLKFVPDSGAASRLEATFSKHPELYVWTMQCFAQPQPVGFSSCPSNLLLIWLKVFDYAKLDDMCWSEVFADLKKHTGVHYCGHTNFPRIFIATGNTCE